MTPDNMEQKAREWWDKYAEDADTHNTHPAEHCAAFARSLVPIPLSMTEEEIDRIGREQYPPDTTNDGEPWYNHEQATRNMYFKDGLRYASTHTKTITVDEERTFTESEVRAMMDDVKSIAADHSMKCYTNRINQMTPPAPVAFHIDNYLWKAHGLSSDPA